MHRDEAEDTTIYKVVVNHEEQYSIWPADRDNPLGWQNVGKSGLKAECLAYIEEVWTDMRPLSLRKKMAEAAQGREQSHAMEATGAAPSTAVRPETTGEDLVKRLSEGAHAVEVDLRPEKSVQVLRECLDRGYIPIKFTETRGGTELGVRLDRDATNLSQVDFENQTGTIHVVGRLSLNYVKVQCIADFDLKTFTGQGRLEPIEE
jgi:uncharacterized protein YbdZ (MbtH family)